MIVLATNPKLVMCLCEAGPSTFVQVCLTILDMNSLMPCQQFYMHTELDLRML